MSTYCKAYTLKRLREFRGWTENLDNASGTTKNERRMLGDLDIVYVQEDFTVTAGIYPGEHVIFSNIRPDWIEFCSTVLNFKIPSYTRESL